MTEDNLENDDLMERLAACNSPEELANIPICIHEGRNRAEVLLCLL